MIRLLGATLTGVLFCFVGPPFALLALVGIGTLYLMRLGYSTRDAFWHVARMLDQATDAMGPTGNLVLLLGLCAAAALSAGIAAARITRAYDYVASIFIILICAGTLLYVGRFWPQSIYLWLFIAGGTVCVLFGTFIGRRTHWPDSRPAPARRLP